MTTKKEIEMTVENEINEIYNIHENNWDSFKDKVEKLNRKIKRLGLDFEEFSIIADPVGYEFFEDENKPGQGHKVYEVLVAGKIVRVEGWEFVARLRHDKEAGVMVDTQPGKECPVQYREADHRNCDHCHTKRYRKDTFVLRNVETDEYMQVGRQCLRDFYGHDIDKIAKLAEFWFECHRAALEPVDNTPRDPNSINLESCLAFTVRAIAESGWISRGTAYGMEDITSTADQALNIMASAFRWTGLGYVTPEPGPTVQERETVRDAISYWLDIVENKTNLNDFEHNIGIIAKSTYVSYKDVGRAAAMIMSYQKAMDRLKAAELRKTLVGKSEHVGAVGDVLENMEFTVEMRRMVEGAWGSSPMTKMRDKDGNTFTVFGGKWTTEIEAGQKIVMKRGRIKKHDEFRDEKQTVLTHVKQANEE